jgi:hypothetical protein
MVQFRVITIVLDVMAQVENICWNESRKKKWKMKSHCRKEKQEAGR